LYKAKRCDTLSIWKKEELVESDLNGFHRTVRKAAKMIHRGIQMKEERRMDAAVDMGQDKRKKTDGKCKPKESRESERPLK